MTSRRGGIIKAAFFVAFIIGAIYIVRSTTAKELLTRESLGNFLAAAGFWAPLVFMLVYAAGVCLFVPGTLLTALGAAIFGAYWGFLYLWMGAMAGATAAFWIGRTLGRDFAASLIGDRLKKYDDAIERNGFAAVLYLRLVYFPFTAMNFGMGLTKVRFWDYFWGHRIGHRCGHLHFHIFRWHPERGLGQWSGRSEASAHFRIDLASRHCTKTSREVYGRQGIMDRQVIESLVFLVLISLPFLG